MMLLLNCCCLSIILCNKRLTCKSTKMVEQPLCTDHQEEDAQHRSYSLVVSALAHEEHHSARSPELGIQLVSAAAVVGTSPTS